VGTDVPVQTYAIPANGAPLLVSGSATGNRFSTGIALAITAAITDADTTAVAASEIKVAISYT
jgi:hypothetical protein